MIFLNLLYCGKFQIYIINLKIKFSLNYSWSSVFIYTFQNQLVNLILSDFDLKSIDEFLWRSSG